MTKNRNFLIPCNNDLKMKIVHYVQERISHATNNIESKAQQERLEDHIDKFVYVYVLSCKNLSLIC